MKAKLIIFLCFALITASSYPEKNNGTDNNLLPPSSYDSFIGKTFVDDKEIDPGFSSPQFSRLYENEKYYISISANSPHRNINKWYLLFTKIVGYNGPNAINKILDIVNVDMSNFSPNTKLWIDECDCVGQRSCNTIAIYHHDEEMAAKGIMVTPLKVWRPNIATGKLEEISPNSVRCGSEPPPED